MALAKSVAECREFAAAAWQDRVCVSSELRTDAGSTQQRGVRILSENRYCFNSLFARLANR